MTFPNGSVRCLVIALIVFLKLFRVCIVFVMYSSISWIWSGAPGNVALDAVRVFWDLI